VGVESEIPRKNRKYSPYIFIISCNFDQYCTSWDLIDLDRDTDQWRALVNALMNLLVP
jgi:hypothetical protein